MAASTANSEVKFGPSAVDGMTCLSLGDRPLTVMKLKGERIRGGVILPVCPDDIG